MSRPARPVVPAIGAWEVVGTGPVSLPAPSSGPRQLDGARGHLWQWVGDGRPLLSLSVAARTTRLGTVAGTAGHLGWEVRQVTASLDDLPTTRTTPDVAVEVRGASAARAAYVDGVREGLAVRTAVVVSTDGQVQHVLRVVVADTGDGRDVVDRVLGDLEVHPWRPR